MAQRKLDVVLDSMKRLQRMGATANLVNLLQKQHPADLAQLFSELSDKDRRAAFSVLVERNSRLAMEALSELGPEAGAAILADRSAVRIMNRIVFALSEDRSVGEAITALQSSRVVEVVFYLFIIGARRHLV